MPRHCRALSLACAVLSAFPSAAAASDPDAAPVRLMVLDPGHFHAALLQKEMLPGVDRTVYVYAPLGPDLFAHLSRIAQFNGRAENPTRWISRIYAAPDYLDRMLAEKPGNVLLLSGRNRGKIDVIQRALDAGIHVLADKPWIIRAADFPKLERALATARRNRLVAYDVMTQRFEITAVVQRELVDDRELFGDFEKGSPHDPAITVESIHYLMKLVAGKPNLRPPWFFDISQQGEGLADVGTHFVDLVQWMVSPETPIDYRHDVQVLGARRWPTTLTTAEFERITGEPAFPPELKPSLRQGRLEYFCNDSALYALRGIHVSLSLEWKFEAPQGSGDTDRMIVRGSLARVEVRQGGEEKFKPEVYVIPSRPDLAPRVKDALQRRLLRLETSYPGIAMQDLNGVFHITIPDVYRIGHEADFALAAGRFLDYMKNPAAMPPWEDSFMLAKYYTTTQAVEMARNHAQ